MIAVIFEVWPAEGRSVAYFDLAGTLRADLEKLDEFISIERFQSLTTPGKLLSLSFWRDEEAVRTWRNLEGHRRAQAQGRGGVFADYACASHRSFATTDCASVLRRLKTAAPLTVRSEIHRRSEVADAPAHHLRS